MRIIIPPEGRQIKNEKGVLVIDPKSGEYFQTVSTYIHLNTATLSNLAGASGGLRIGSNSNLEAGTFWSGMIDDIRICDRVVAP